MSAEITIKVEYERALRSLISMNTWLVPAVEEGLLKGADMLISAAQDRASHVLKSANRYNVHFAKKLEQRLNVSVSNDHPYAAAIEGGVPAHPITAKNKAMKFMSESGTLVYRKSVMHPGARAFRILYWTARNYSTAVAWSATNSVNQMLRKFGK